MASWKPIGTYLWLDADDDDTITSDSGLVSGWSDKSGNGLSAVQANAANKPSLSSDAYGRSLITFDGVDDYMTTASLTLGAPTTLFIAFRAHTVTSGDRTLINQQSGDDTEPWQLYFTSDAKLRDWRSLGYVGSIQNNTLHVLSEVQEEDKKIYMWRTGNAGTTGTNLTLYAASRAISIGRSQSVGSLGWYDGDIAEIILYNSALSTADRQRVEGYLAWKWVVQDQLPADHPYKLGAPGDRPVCYLHARRDRLDMRGVSTQNQLE